MVALVTAALAAQDITALYQFEQAPAPCHSCGCKSSMTTESSVHGAMSVLKLPLLKASVHRCAISITSVLSDAPTGVAVAINNAPANRTLRIAFPSRIGLVTVSVSGSLAQS